MRKSLPILFGTLLTLAAAVPVSAFTEGACAKDAEKYCPNVPPGEGRIKKCLSEHVDKLSDACKTNILEAAVKKQENKAKSGGY
ncbi:MAG TPA: hypothetical protein DF383_02300 [Deltaproteobacteria bacterium]|nr:hypothetical protein [Deltaproteobacteria bacterium]